VPSSETEGHAVGYLPPPGLPSGSAQKRQIFAAGGRDHLGMMPTLSPLRPVPKIPLHAEPAQATRSLKSGIFGR